MFLYVMLTIFTSSGFGELNSSTPDDDDDGRERIDDNDDLEDV